MAASHATSHLLASAVDGTGDPDALLGMVGLAVASPEQVQRLYAKALELGARDEGAPGPRPSGFYCAYFRDLDGNKLNFFCPLPSPA
jgi:predicted lactoylglutathione lyase